jgi:hypothetical protein
VRQVIPRGPVASQEAIKQLGTNGGGFFNANGASPFENPTGLTNFLSIVLILCIPVALTYTFGKMVGSIRQGAYLARNAGKVCTRQMILENVWGPGYGTEIALPEGLRLPRPPQARRRERAVPAKRPSRRLPARRARRLTTRRAGQRLAPRRAPCPRHGRVPIACVAQGTRTIHEARRAVGRLRDNCPCRRGAIGCSIRASGRALAQVQAQPELLRRDRARPAAERERELPCQLLPAAKAAGTEEQPHHQHDRTRHRKALSRNIHSRDRPARPGEPGLVFWTRREITPRRPAPVKRGTQRGVWRVAWVTCLGTLLRCGHVSNSGRRRRDLPLPNAVTR